MPDALPSLAQPEVTAAPVVTVPSNYLLVKHTTVPTRVVGGGTSSVMPAGAVGISLPEGAVLVTSFERSTGCAG